MFFSGGGGVRSQIPNADLFLVCFTNSIARLSVSPTPSSRTFMAIHCSWGTSQGSQGKWTYCQNPYASKAHPPKRGVTRQVVGGHTAKSLCFKRPPLKRSFCKQITPVSGWNHPAAAKRFSSRAENSSARIGSPCLRGRLHRPPS